MKDNRTLAYVYFGGDHKSLGPKVPTPINIGDVLVKPIGSETTYILRQDSFLNRSESLADFCPLSAVANSVPLPPSRPFYLDLYGLEADVFITQEAAVLPPSTPARVLLELGVAT